jgi:hypothetical protein
MAALPVVEDLDVFEERGLRPAPGSEPRATHRVLLSRSDIDHPTISIVARSFTRGKAEGSVL